MTSADAARDDREVLVQPQRLALALRLLPARRAAACAHLLPRVGDRLEPAILRVRPAGLERHHEGLPGRVHDRVGDQERSAC